ncbi:hypothetical protein PPL_00758 [Heterostelium album PN500]|uniref:Uncharacterized protein n=1 Tax=Heterostelium pallidum (strain ATCC 26659 / Pp 5 / PN500) TaxID=670386 RepID=D3AXC7_HETP5|nr:hypothetical protein PPL_00758 [Heterostelium album PN500]EFA86196.1 hypothetical protein PPL_00758 [Heterostelium album PN500]|eukprot:XP_020438301.1 hypothetical protein PPL_00758 [Heterostelium album PN500]
MEGKVILVTGGGSGIGRAICLELAKQKCKVGVADINVKGALDTIDLMKEVNSDVDTVAIKCDISNIVEVEKMMVTLIDKFQRIDGAVNNAGYLGTPSKIGEADISNFDKVIDINLKGTFYCMIEEIKQMEKQTREEKDDFCIVNISSVASMLGVQYFAPYACIKSGINAFTKTGALEYGERGIRINSVAPGTIMTPMLGQLLPTEDHMKMSANKSAMKRHGKPSEIADAVTFLLSPKATFITGHTMVVDGGFTLF